MDTYSTVKYPPSLASQSLPRVGALCSGPRRQSQHLVLVGMLTVILVVSSSSRAGASTGGAAQLQRITDSPYVSVLANVRHHSLYVLSVERNGHLHCTKTCLSIWHPFLVASSARSVKLGPGVRGRIGFVSRSKWKKQVTFNGYPIYTFAGDNSPGQSNGQDIVAEGGTWHLTNAQASTPGATPLSSPSTTTTLPLTTTTISGATTTTIVQGTPTTTTTTTTTTTVYVY